jgi:hypothetical protein
MMEGVLSSDQCEVYNLTGDEGNMMKDAVMGAFAEGDSYKIVVATEVAKAGISSSFCGSVLQVPMSKSRKDLVGFTFQDYIQPTIYYKTILTQ